MSFQTINPYTSEKLAQFPYDTSVQIQHKISLAEDCFTDWKRLSFNNRGVYFLRLAELLENKKEELSRLISLEMGKPLRESISEIEKTARTALYYAQHAELLLANVSMKASQKAEVHFRPLGVIFGIFPWNYPVWQVLRFVIPTLMAGNTAVFKHAENTPQCALAIVQLFKEAGFPVGAIDHLFVRHEDVEQVISNPFIHAVTFTGSEMAGRSVATLSGKHLKKVVLELGGSDPFIVFPDASIEDAAKSGVLARYQNTGQSCIAAKRFIIHDQVYDQFLEAFISEINNLHAGDPLVPGTTLGVLARPDLSEKLTRQVQDTVHAGARLLFGGQASGATGFIPGILENIPKESPAYQEELFGPVAGMFRVKNQSEALFIANATNFGLGASVWTKDEEKFRSLATEIESGMVYWNSMVRSTPELPFGGVKNSGIGRELSEFGIHEFTNIQLLYPF